MELNINISVKFPDLNQLLQLPDLMRAVQGAEKPEEAPAEATKAPKARKSATKKPEAVTVPEPEPLTKQEATDPVAAPATPVQTAAPAQAEEPKLTARTIAVAGAKLLQRNPAVQSELGKLLQEYGLRSAMEIKPEQMDGFAAALRGLGAEI